MIIGNIVDIAGRNLISRNNKKFNSITEFPASDRGERKGGRMEELKKCPFCGGEASVKMEHKHSIGWTIWCGCKNCYAESSGYCPDLTNENIALGNIEKCKKLAIEAWNRRVE